MFNLLSVGEVLGWSMVFCMIHWRLERDERRRDTNAYIIHRCIASFSICTTFRNQLQSQSIDFLIHP